MLVVFLGPPGAGKGTQAALLLSYLRIVHLSSGELLRAAAREGTPLGKLARQYIDVGQLVPDEVMIDLIAGRLGGADCRSGCLLDGFPRTLPQAHALDAMLAEQQRRLDVVLALHVTAEELVRRLIVRGRQEGRKDDLPETIVRRMEIYQQRTRPLIEYYRKQSILCDIDAIGSTDEVFQRIRAAVDDVRTRQQKYG